MTESHGVNRRRRRKLICGGWLLSMLLSGVLLIVLSARGPLGCLLGLAVAIVAAALWHRWMIREGGIPVLIYHSVSDKSDWLPWARDISVTPDSFVQHLETLRSLGCAVIRTSDLIKARQLRRPLPPRAVALNLDDGYLDNWVAAFPILKRFGVPATIYVSLDFIEAGETPRPTIDDLAAGRCRTDDMVWDGYLNWAELRLMEQSGLVEVESHGVDHGRVPVGPDVIDTIRSDNWRQHAWLQWQAMPGNKSDWFRHCAPPLVPCGSAVPVNAPALTARAWREGDLESHREYKARVSHELRRSREELAKELGKDVLILCWPFNASTPVSNELAFAAGFQAVTGGDDENREGQDPAVISRVHVTDLAIGWRWPAANRLAFRANVRLFQGNYYWGLVALPTNLIRKLAARLADGRTAVTP